MLKPFHLVAALPLLVSACGSYQGIDYAQGCPADAAERVQAADWARVRTITVRVRRDEFVPMIISFTQDRPYVLRLENVDRVSHVFRAPKFFEAIAMESATVGDRELAEDCPKRIILEAEETAEIRFVAVRDGHYDFVDSKIPYLPFTDSRFPFTYRGEAVGVIAIEPKRVVIIGSPKPVKFDEPAPTAPVEAAPSDNPFDTFEPPPDDAGKPAPEEAPNPFDAVDPAPEEAPTPFDAVEPAPAEAPTPFDAIEPAPAEAPGPMVQTMPSVSPAPPPEPEDDTNPFGALEPDRSLPME